MKLSVKSQDVLTECICMLFTDKCFCCLNPTRDWTQGANPCLRYQTGTTKVHHPPWRPCYNFHLVQERSTKLPRNYVPPDQKRGSNYLFHVTPAALKPCITAEQQFLVFAVDKKMGHTVGICATLSQKCNLVNRPWKVTCRRGLFSCWNIYLYYKWLDLCKVGDHRTLM